MVEQKLIWRNVLTLAQTADAIMADEDSDMEFVWVMSPTTLREVERWAGKANFARLNSDGTATRDMPIFSGAHLYGMKILIDERAYLHMRMYPNGR